jgi:hypothetical protein
VDAGRFEEASHRRCEEKNTMVDLAGVLSTFSSPRRRRTGLA